MVSNFFSSVSSSASSSTQVVTPCIDFSDAVWSPELVLIPLKIILLPVTLLIISSFVMWKCGIRSNSSIFSKNSGMIEIEAEVRVYLVNKIVCSLSNVSKRIKIEILKDLPDALPPLTIK